MTDLTALVSRLQDLLSPDFGVGATDPKAPAAPLWPTEEMAVASAVHKRKLEFAAGRAAARQAMLALSVSPRPIPVHPDRSAIWPEDLIGSIAHCDIACIAAVSKKGTAQAIGIDIEPDEPLPEDIRDTVLLPAERVWLAKQPADRQGHLATLIFCAKESAFKAQYPLSRQLFGFEVLEVAFDHTQGQFTATFQNPVPPFAKSARLNGRFAASQSLVMSAVVIS